MKKFFLSRKDGPDKIAAHLEQARQTMPPDVWAAHKHSSKHREEILKSEQCGCFYCEKTFGPHEILDWTDDQQTALCPKCGIDSVIGSTSGFPINKEFLHQMCEHWF